MDVARGRLLHLSHEELLVLDDQESVAFRGTILAFFVMRTSGQLDCIALNNIPPSASSPFPYESLRRGAA